VNRSITAGFYSPLPPAGTGVADYSATLLAELRRHGTVEVAPARCDAALYHLGNNALHASVYRRALESPGVVVLHDSVLHHFLLGQLPEAAYIEEFVYNYGEWNRGRARDLWMARSSSGSDSRYFEAPLLKRATERALAVVVHNPAAAEVVKAHAPQARIVEIPHLFQPRPLRSEADRLRYRRSLGIAPGAFLFGMFGYLRESKRLIQALDAFAEIHRELPDTAFLVAGDFVSRDLALAAAPLLTMPGVVRLPHLSESDFWLAAASVDACINLKYPAAGETSGIGIRLMGLGKPVMVTDSPECARYPQDSCVRVAAGAAESDSLRQNMILLASAPEAAKTVGENAAAHIQTRHRLEWVGEQYWELLKTAASSPQKTRRKEGRPTT
jgi:glycosyltransferase involved in cell wall biosynthesis